MKIGSYPSIEHLQSNNWCAQLGTMTIIGPKETYICHPETYFAKKGDPYWKICSKHNEIGPYAKKRTNIG